MIFMLTYSRTISPACNVELSSFVSPADARQGQSASQSAWNVWSCCTEGSNLVFAHGVKEKLRRRRCQKWQSLL